MERTRMSKIHGFFWHFLILLVAWGIFEGKEIYSFSTKGANKSTFGLSWLKIGVGAKAAGMGNTGVTSVRDATAIYWNPAGLTRASGTGVVFSYNSWFQGVSNSYLGFSFPGERNFLGFSFYLSDVGEIERRGEAPTIEPLGKFSAHYLAAFISLARRFENSLSLGATLKYLYEKIYIHSASGFGLDFGVIYPLPAWGATFGAVLQNLGGMGKLKDKSSRIPAVFKLGVGKEVSNLHWNGISIEFSADFGKYIGSYSFLRLGAELRGGPHINLRGGYELGEGSGRFGTGLGIKFKIYRFDYSYSPFEIGLGESHRVSIGIEF
ncbi:MAG: PorV/PorQ family protein [Fidelibacterota bacterium]